MLVADRLNKITKLCGPLSHNFILLVKKSQVSEKFYSKIPLQKTPVETKKKNPSDFALLLAIFRCIWTKTGYEVLYCHALVEMMLR